MVPITLKIPEIEWSDSFHPHWHGESPSRTHPFNALSLLFPQGERFFIEVTREVKVAHSDSLSPELNDAVDAFIAQEAAHTNQHKKYNAALESLGYQNIVYQFTEHLQKQSYQHLSMLTRLAIVCAYEHYTAILGNFILSNPQILAAVDQKMALIWGWHSAEETEHKAVCFDLYQAAGGGWLRRSAAFIFTTLEFNLIFFRLYFHMLARDGCLQPRRLARTLFETAEFYFGKQGVGWDLIRHSFKYLSPSFHPWQLDNRDKLARWLEENNQQLRTIMS